MDEHATDPMDEPAATPTHKVPTAAPTNKSTATPTNKPTAAPKYLGSLQYPSLSPQQRTGNGRLLPFGILRLLHEGTDTFYQSGIPRCLHHQRLQGNNCHSTPVPQPARVCHRSSHSNSSTEFVLPRLFTSNTSARYNTHPSALNKEQEMDAFYRSVY